MSGRMRAEMILSLHFIGGCLMGVASTVVLIVEAGPRLTSGTNCVWVCVCVCVCGWVWLFITIANADWGLASIPGRVFAFITVRRTTGPGTSCLRMRQSFVRF